MSLVVKRLDNIDVMCSDLDPMRAFYGDVLGLPQWREFEPGQSWIGYRAGDVVIYVIQEGSDASPRFSGQTPAGSPHLIAFEVEDLDAAMSEIEGRGIEWDGDLVTSAKMRYRGVRDPENNLVYLAQPRAEEAEPAVPAAQAES
jgi:catechol 2,3-dioxygenase-like lactoylglutathione lyase family enzyme